MSGVVLALDTLCIKLTVRISNILVATCPYMSAFTVIDHSYEDAPQPNAITLAMKSHQSKMYKHCLKLERNEITFKSTQGDTIYVHSAIGVIGNSVGSGKSLIMMALMATPIFDTERRVYFESSMLVQAFKCDKYSPANNINVLLVPHGIFLQWLTYLNDQTTLSYESVVCK